MNLQRTVFYLALCVAVSGCFTIDTASTDAFKASVRMSNNAVPLEHVVASNYGWYLFNTVPLVCGRIDDGIVPWVFFEDNVNLKTVHNELMKYAVKNNSNVYDINARAYENVLLSIPGLSIPIAIPYLLCYKEIQTSAVLVQPKPMTKDEVADEMRALLKTLDGTK